MPHVVFIVTAILGVAVFAALAYRRRHRADERHAIARPVRELWRPAQPLSASPATHRPALGRAPEIHNHIHLHGLSAEEIAAVLRRIGG